MHFQTGFGILRPPTATRGKLLANSTPHKITTSVGLTSRQLGWLTTEAKRLGISMAEVIRRTLDAAEPANRDPRARRLYENG